MLRKYSYVCDKSFKQETHIPQQINHFLEPNSKATKTYHFQLCTRPKRDISPIKSNARRATTKALQNEEAATPKLQHCSDDNDAEAQYLYTGGRRRRRGRELHARGTINIL